MWIFGGAGRHEVHQRDCVCGDDERRQVGKLWRAARRAPDTLTTLTPWSP
jgi:hypothetical protein